MTAAFDLAFPALEKLYQTGRDRLRNARPRGGEDLGAEARQASSWRRTRSRT